MNNRKLFLAVSTAAVAVAAVAAPVSAAPIHTFTDVGPSYDEAVSFLYEYEILNGKSATQFGTYQQLTRGDAAVILANAIGVDTEIAPDAGFTDLNDRVRGAVNGLAEYEIVSGVTKTQFKPNDILTRGAMAKLLVAAFELQEFEEETPFTDVAGVFTPYINALYGTGITSGKTATSYGAYTNITRGDFANLLYNTISFVMESFYFPEVASAELVGSTAVKVKMTEAVPSDFRAQDLAQLFYFTVKFEDGSKFDFTPTTASFSADRLFTTFNLGNMDLSGKKGEIIIDDFENETAIPFDFSVQTGTPVEVLVDAPIKTSTPTAVLDK